jgi:hypothetical protein
MLEQSRPGFANASWKADPTIPTGHQPPNHHALPLPDPSRPYRQRSTLPEPRVRFAITTSVSNNYQLLLLDRNSERRKIRAYRIDARIPYWFGRVVPQHGNGEMIRIQPVKTSECQYYFTWLTLPGTGPHLPAGLIAMRTFPPSQRTLSRHPFI